MLQLCTIENKLNKKHCQLFTCRPQGKPKNQRSVSNHLYTTLPLITRRACLQAIQNNSAYEIPTFAGLGDDSIPLSLVLLERRDLGGAATPVFIISLRTNWEAHHTAVRHPRVFNAISRTDEITEIISRTELNTY